MASRVDRFWLWQSDVYKQPNLKRLIIQHPDNPLVGTFAEKEKGDEVTYRRTIIIVSQKAFDNHVAVVWAMEPIIGLVIAKEKQGEGWAKVEYFIPHCTTPDAMPSFVVYENKKREQKLFQRLCESYDQICDDKANVQVTKEILLEWKRKYQIPSD